MAHEYDNDTLLKNSYGKSDLFTACIPFGIQGGVRSILGVDNATGPYDLADRCCIREAYIGEYWENLLLLEEEYERLAKERLKEAVDMDL